MFWRVFVLLPIMVCLPRCIISTKSETTTELKLTFSHPQYAILYMRFLDRVRESNSSLLHGPGLRQRTVFVKPGIEWSLEDKDYVFANEQDAQRWKEAIPFYQESGSPVRLNIRKEISCGRFMADLQVPEEEWQALWEGATELEAPGPSLTSLSKQWEKKESKGKGGRKGRWKGRFSRLLFSVTPS